MQFIAFLLASCGSASGTPEVTQKVNPSYSPTLSVSATATNTPLQLPTDSPVPEFIIRYHPRDTIELVTYNNSLSGGTPSGIQIDFKMGRDDWESKESISLSLDDKQVSSIPSIGDGLVENGPFSLSWIPEIEPGLHEACFEIVTAEGEVLAYCWYFLVKDSYNLTEK